MQDKEKQDNVDQLAKLKLKGIFRQLRLFVVVQLRLNSLCRKSTGKARKKCKAWLNLQRKCSGGLCLQRRGVEILSKSNVLNLRIIRKLEIGRKYILGVY